MIDLLQYDFMQRAFAAALLVGLIAPIIGTFLVQRRLALLGDGIGHVALTGVALGLLTGTSPILTALLVSAMGAILIEVVRARARTSGDIALALLFYGGIAGGVLLIGIAPGQGNATLTSYLFGSVSSVGQQDVYIISGLALAVLAVVGYFGRELFVLCQDEDVARAHGLPVRLLSVIIAVTAALTVVIAMRVVGVLLVSALMVVPVAAAQQLSRSFRATMAVAVAIGMLSAVGGLAGAYYTGLAFGTDVAPGGAIVLLAIAVFGMAVLVGYLVRGRDRHPRTSRHHGANVTVGTEPQTGRGKVST